MLAVSIDCKIDMNSLQDVKVCSFLSCIVQVVSAAIKRMDMANENPIDLKNMLKDLTEQGAIRDVSENSSLSATTADMTEDYSIETDVVSKVIVILYISRAFDGIFSL